MSLRLVLGQKSSQQHCRYLEEWVRYTVTQILSSQNHMATTSTIYWEAFQLVYCQQRCTLQCKCRTQENRPLFQNCTPNKVLWLTSLDHLVSVLTPLFLILAIIVQANRPGKSVNRLNSCHASVTLEVLTHTIGC